MVYEWEQAPKKACRVRLGDHGAVCPLHVLVCARLGHMWAEGSHVLCLLSVGPALERRLACLWCPLGLGAHPWCLLGTGVIVLVGIRCLVTSTRALPCSAADSAKTLPLVSRIPVLASWHGLHSYPGAHVRITSITGGVEGPADSEGFWGG